MKRTIAWKVIAGITLIIIPSLVFASKPPDDAQKARVMNRAYQMQIPFIENKGQIGNNDVSFYAKTFGGTLFVENDGTLTYSLPFEDKGGVVIREVFTNKKIKVQGLDPAPTRVNYFKGKDKNEWKSNIPSYARVSLGEVYKGVDLTLKAYGNNVEKLFTVLPEVNPEVIKVQIQGAKGLKVNENGELEVITKLGSVKFTKPLAYQTIEDEKKSVEVAYAIHNESYGFKVEDYDKQIPLIIDPLLASTFIGGSGNETGQTIIIDESYVYVMGTAYSSEYPTTSGAYDESYNGDYDAFISKLNSDLTTLLASTFLGGSSRDGGSSVIIDGSHIYITGGTKSSDFPTTTGAYDESFNIGSEPYLDNVYISKLNSDLTTLEASTFLGKGSGHSIAFDGGYVYIGGATHYSDFPHNSRGL